MVYYTNSVLNLYFRQKFILSKGEVFVKIGYLYKGIFKLNINKNVVDAYIFYSSYL